MNTPAIIDFKAPIQIENERVLLRPLELNDFENLLHFSENEPDIWQYSSMQAIGAKGLAQYLKLATDARAAGKEFPFIVYDKQAKKYAGSTRFYDIQLQHNSLQLGFTWYGKAFQGTGLNKHCKFLLLNYAFEEMGIERVEFRADNRNLRSIAAMKSIGCREEGVLRSSGWTPEGTRRDSIVLSILKNEWHNSVKENLKAKINS